MAQVRLELASVPSKDIRDFGSALKFMSFTVDLNCGRWVRHRSGGQRGIREMEGCETIDHRSSHHSGLYRLPHFFPSLLVFALQVSSFGFGGTNAHATCKGQGKCIRRIHYNGRFLTCTLNHRIVTSQYSTPNLEL